MSNKFFEILLSLTQPTTAAGAYIDGEFNGTSVVLWVCELLLVGGAFLYAVMDYPFDGNDVFTTNSTDGTQTNTGKKAVSEATTTTIFIFIRLIVVAISVVLNLFQAQLSYDKLWRFLFSLVETASAVLPVVGLSMMEATDNAKIDTCNNNQWIIHGFLIGSLAVRLGRTFAVLDWCNKSYNKLNDGSPSIQASDQSWKQRKANYASIRSKAKEEVTYNFQSSGVQRHDLI